ncbi:MAG TPA: hypothetical protein VFH54_12885 [Mycobacteriales bacterium]|nr:hypothetical protein [Mycobacteriales bacterium]
MDGDAREPALLRRIEELAARAAQDEPGPPEGPVLAAALTGLRAELGGLRAEIGTLRADLAAVRSGVDASNGRLTSALSAARSESEDLARRHDELREKVGDLADTMDDVRSLLPDLRVVLAEQPGAAGAVQSALTRLAEDVDDKVETLSADLRRTLTAGLTQASAGSRAAETAWTEVRATFEERLAAVEDTLDGLAEGLEAQTRDSIGAATERIARVDAKLEHVVADATEAQQQWASDIRAALADVAGALDRSLGSLGESLTTAVQSSREAERSHLEQIVADLQSAMTVSRDSNAGAVADLRGFLDGFQTNTERRLEEVRAVLADGMSEAREGLVTELSSTIHSLETANSASARLVEEEVTSLRSDLADALEEVRDRISTMVAKAQEAIAASVDEQRSTFDETVRGLRSDVLDRVEESTATVSTGLDELRGGVVTASRAGDQTVSRVNEFATTLQSLDATVAEMHADWERRTDAAIELVANAGHAAVDEFRQEIRDLVSDLKRAVHDSAESVDESGDVITGATGRLVAAGEALLAYLARRDQLLEQERDRVLHEMLDEFGQGLSAKERRSLSARVGEALDRRRDARDADRYRSQNSGEAPLEIPEPPPDLAALVAPPAPVAPSTKTTPAKKAPAKKAAAKTTPAKKAPGKKAPAAKSAAKKTPATKGTVSPTKPAVAKKTTSPAKTAAKQAPEPPVGERPMSPEGLNTTEPLDDEGTTRV